MDRLLYLAMTGASQNTMAIQAHSNNLANISTSGFRRDFEQARSMQTFGESYPSRVYSMSERPGTDFTPGTLQETGRDLDVAIQGDGWIAVQGADGKEAYVRTGSLKVDALGMLRTGNDLPVLGNGGPIAVPPNQQIEIGQDGSITVRGAGENTNALAVIDRIKLVNPDPKTIEKGLDGTIRTKDGKPAAADASVQVVSGFTESSNVSAVEEMTSILSLSKQFELQIKMMKSAEDNDASMAKVLQFS
ncbi:MULTISPECIES: flagellar basal body rod protein FlgF [unclassified Pseudomonas]|uniref:flagellar basal body rod protein FlgF n=1 Tax=unclassified Pseudomonas TaxID=196821 RepID=UPI00131A63CF|nr:MULTISPECIES: flagellar basal body rod protein FlgF [unclassified Pseudomonas]